MQITRTLFSLLLVCGWAGSLLAQQDLTVILRNYQTNEVAPNVEVTLRHDPTGLVRQRLTDEQGRAVFRGIAALSGYSLTVAETDEFLETSLDNVDIRSNQNPTVELIRLSKRTIELVGVEVTAGGATQINRQDAEVSFELKRAEIQSLPIEGRDITRVLYRLPNVSQATGFYPEAPNVSINGANSLFTSYLIDGLDNNERFLGGQKFAIPSGFTRNITVLTNNYSAEYGLTANGVVDITSMSGGNEFSGEAFVISRPGPVIDGRSAYAQRDLSGNLVKDGFQRYQAGVGFGGALVRDQTFYYVNVEHTTDVKDNLLNSPALGVNETVRGTNTFNYISAKLDHQWSSRFRSSLRANLGLVAIERQGGGLEGGVSFPSAANFQDRNSLLVAWKNAYLGEKFAAETNLQYARFRWNYGRPLNEGSPQVAVLDPGEQTIAVLGHPGYIFDATENTVQFQQKFKYYARKHTFKAGLGLISADHQLLGGGNVNGNYTVKLTPAQLSALRGRNLGSALSVTDIPADVQVLAYGVELRPASFGTRQTVYSAYLEDQFTAGERLNVILGIRFDYDNLSKGGSTAGDLNNLAPRVNLNYKLGQRSALRAGYGIFYDKIPYAIYSDALQQNTTSADYRRQLQELIRLGQLPADTDIDRITFAGNLGGFASGVPYLQGPSFDQLQAQREGVFSNERRILNPSGYQNPYTHQVALGYQLQVDAKSLFFVDFVHNQSYDLFRLRNLNAAAAYPLPDPGAVTVRTPAQADATRPIPIVNGSYALINGEQVSGVARNIVVSESGGRSRYYAASVNLQKERGEDRYAYRLNYTLSLLENNTEDINFRAMDANNFAAEWGPSINDRTHIISSIFSYYPAGDFSITLASLLQSGQPINRIPDALLFGTTDLNGDGSSFGDAYVGNSDRFPGEGRNNDRLPWSNVFDVSMQYLLPAGGGRLEFRADIFNVFNAQNLSGYSNNATQSNQIQPGSKASGLLIRRNAGAPRQFQLGIRYLW
ncbi:MAG: TonB-dependent receptor [Lewinellaceae bacterium]|nr:TonB-dependent receptor [Lewinellaceae bacterium]